MTEEGRAMKKAGETKVVAHNRMQMLFRKPEMCVAAYCSIVGDTAIDIGICARLQERLGGRGYDAAGCRIDGYADKRVEEARQAGIALAQVIEAPAREKAEKAADWKTPDIEWEERRAANAELKEISEGIKVAGETAARIKIAELAAVAARGERERFYVRIADRVRFEQGGWDLGLEPSWGVWSRNRFWLPDVLIEVAPKLGDDYPSMLRTLIARRRMREMDRRALIVDRFDAEGATYEDVVWAFGQHGIEVRTLAEIGALMPAPEAAQ